MYNKIKSRAVNLNIRIKGNTDWISKMLGGARDSAPFSKSSTLSKYENNLV